jgi:nitrogen fixation protein NifU and related proteins
MSDVRALYEQVILDHNKTPRNYGEMPDADRMVDGINPLCGDNITVYVRFNGEVIQDLRFSGHGCAISKSSASLMTTALKGKTKTEVLELFNAFHEMLKSDASAPLDEARLGKLKVFSGVREYPMRIKCATLAWHALKSCLVEESLSQAPSSVSTE